MMGNTDAGIAVIGFVVGIMVLISIISAPTWIKFIVKKINQSKEDK